MQSVDDADLDVGPTRVTIKVPTLYLLDITLPFGVEDGRGSAKFDAATKTLKLWLPVLKSQPGYPKNCNTLAAPPAAEIATDSIQEKATEHVESVDEDTCASVQRCTENPALESGGSGDADQLTVAPDSSTAELLEGANVVAESSIGAEQHAASGCEGVDTGTVESPADTAAQRATGTEISVCENPHEGTSAETGECQDSAPCDRAAGISQGLGGKVDLKALALQWDSVNRACDAEMSAAKSEPVVCEAGSAPTAVRKEGALMRNAIDAANRGAECVPASLPDIQLGLALDLPMLGELD